MLKRTETALAIVLTLIVIFLHVERARRAGALWRDEAGAVQLATLPTVGEVFQRFPHEAFPPLFPLTVRAYTALFGDSDRALRLFGLAVGLGIVGALWSNALAARPERAVPIVSLALLGFHPHFLVYGDSLRGYGLGTLLILLTFGAFARLVERPDRWAIAVAAALAVLSVHVLLHNAALLLGIGLAAAVVGVLRRQPRVTAAALGIGLLAALSLLPYLGPLSAAREWDVLVVQDLPVTTMVSAVLATVGTPARAVLWIWVALLVTAAAAWRLHRRSGDSEEGQGAQLFRRLAIPAACAAQLGLFIAVGYLPRIWYALPLMALIASALDSLLARPASPPLRALRWAVPLLLAALALPATFQEARTRMTNIRRAAEMIADAAGPKDLVVVNYWFYGVSFQRYYQGEARWMTVPRIDDHRFHRYDLLKARMAMVDPNRELYRALRRTLRSGHRVWVVGTLDAPPLGAPVAVLRPAPGRFSGWSDAPYCLGWSRQLHVYLAEHTRRVEQRRAGVGGAVNSYEHVALFVFGGWRDEPDPSIVEPATVESASP
jgi:hypothetical protein